MNSTLLIVALVLTHVYLVAATGGSSSSSTDWVIVKENDMNLLCMNGTTKYGHLMYYRTSEKSIEVLLLSVGEDYRQKGVATVLLNYFIENIARQGNYKQIELSVLEGKQNAAAKKLYENAGFEWISSNRMIKKL